LKTQISTLFIAGAALMLSGCGSGAPGRAEAASSVKLQGAGASFPAPLYNKWFKAYGAAHQNVLVDYQSVGSGGGIKSVMDHTVDFGASDRGHGEGARRRAALSDDRREHRARVQPAGR
jgi:phosphate transport system substrate-binding protein